MRYIVFILFLHSVLTNAQEIKIGERIKLGTIDSETINEASGLAASRLNPGILWTHNDSGDEPRIFAINESGETVAEYYIANQDDKERDWEDICIGPGEDNGKEYIYIGDIGDNDSEREIKHIIKFEEPEISLNSSGIRKDTITECDVIDFIYPDGKRDSEALMIDPWNKDLYVISKREEHSRVYLCKYPQSITNTNTLEFLAELPYGNEGFNSSGVVAADISRTGDHILIRTYFSIYYYFRDNDETISQAVSKSPQELPYTVVLQDEAIAWKYDNSGFYTLNEGKYAAPVLYFYPREDNEIGRTSIKKPYEIIRNKNRIRISFHNDNFFATTLNLSDNAGKIIIKKEYSVDIIEIDGIDKYSKGVYHLLIEVNGRKYYEKIIVN